MAQYHPAGEVAGAKVAGAKYGEIDRRPSRREIDQAYTAARAAGLWRFDERRRSF